MIGKIRLKDNLINYHSVSFFIFFSQLKIILFYYKNIALTQYIIIKL